MEEHVGLIWDRLVTRAAEQRYPAAAVTLEQVSRTVGVLFRALGGDGGLQVEAANATEHGARRTWLQRLAGSNREVELSWRDEQALRLPAVIEYFPEAELNRDLYLWRTRIRIRTAKFANDFGLPFTSDRHTTTLNLYVVAGSKRLAP